MPASLDPQGDGVHLTIPIVRAHGNAALSVRVARVALQGTSAMLLKIAIGLARPCAVVQRVQAIIRRVEPATGTHGRHEAFVPSARENAPRSARIRKRDVESAVSPVHVHVLRNRALQAVQAVVWVASHTQRIDLTVRQLSRGGDCVRGHIPDRSSSWSVRLYQLHNLRPSAAVHVGAIHSEGRQTSALPVWIHHNHAKLWTTVGHTVSAGVAQPSAARTHDAHHQGGDVIDHNPVIPGCSVGIGVLNDGTRRRRQPLHPAHTQRGRNPCAADAQLQQSAAGAQPPLVGGVAGGQPGQRHGHAAACAAGAVPHLAVERAGLHGRQPRFHSRQSGSHVARLSGRQCRRQNGNLRGEGRGCRRQRGLRLCGDGRHCTAEG
eukprot:m.136798 g.136798  ORF g.136798 m.136798 type:complete len:378 (+) comp20206_c0_seq2:58-1191(+)